MSALAPLIAVFGAITIFFGALKKKPQTEPHPQHRLSVTEALARLDELDGTLVEIVGTLNVEFESYSINEQEIPDASGSVPEDQWVGNGGIWTQYDRRFSVAALEKLHKKIVVLLGYIRRPERRYDECGHFSAWPSEIEVISVKVHTAA